MRSAQEIAKRILALTAVSEAAQEWPPNQVSDWLDGFELWAVLSDAELLFIRSEIVQDEIRFSMSWRVEACTVLMWAIGRIDELSAPSSKTSLSELGIGPELLSKPQEFIASAELRPVRELSAAQLGIETEHWGVRAGPAGRRMFGNDDPEGAYNPSIVYQRHYAINWIMGEGEAWDDVLTDT